MVQRWVIAAFAACGVALGAQSVERPVRSPTDPGVVTTRQAITPAGVQSVFDGRVHGVVFGATAGEVWVLSAKRLYRLDWRRNEVLESHDLGVRPGMQALAHAPGVGTVAAGALAPASGRGARAVRLFRVTAAPSSAGPGPTRVGADLGRELAGAVAIAPGPHARALVPLTADNALAIVDLTTGESSRVATDVAPFAAAADERTAWVSTWGRAPREDEPFETTGTRAGADRVATDAGGLAREGLVQRVDLVARKVTTSVSVGRHPTGLALDVGAGRLYVANSNDDTLSVIDTTTAAVVATWPVRPFGDRVAGVAPTAIVVATSRREVLVACGGINAVAVLDAETGRLKGLVPTAWYPNGLALSPDQRHLAVSTLLGVGSGWRHPGGRLPDSAGPESPTRRNVHSYRGAVAILSLPDASQLAAYTRAAWENNRVPAPVVPAHGHAVTALPVPERAGDPSLIEHVVYIVKENRTYDQLFGDLPQANGEPSLLVFGEDVVPNHRQLAREFVLFDNFYATGGNSGDGHQWATQASETSYALWPGYFGRSYPFDGTDPLAYARGGFIWDAAREAGKDVMIFGEYLPYHDATSMEARAALLAEWNQSSTDFRGRWTAEPRVAGMRGLVARDFPAYTNAIPDVVRSRIFRAHLREWESAGRMPHLVLVQLPADHTLGTWPGLSTPRAMLADNDLALGEIVEALSRSRFWPRMAILVVEDDAQDGVDHVDGHRTVALAISPYTRRGHVDSTFYSHPSLLKTIELMLGLRSLSLFDLIANDMRAAFTSEPTLTPYAVRRPVQSLMDVNPPASALRGQARRDALASARMRFEVPDAAPTARLNEIVWRAVRGASTPYPGVRRAVFAPFSIDVDDDDR